MRQSQEQAPSTEKYQGVAPKEIQESSEEVKMVPPRTRSQTDMAGDASGSGAGQASSRLEASVADGIREVNSSGETRVLPAAEVVERFTGLSERAEAAEQKLAEMIAKMSELEASREQPGSQKTEQSKVDEANEGVLQQAELMPVETTAQLKKHEKEETSVSATILREMREFQTRVGSRLDQLERSTGFANSARQEEVAMGAGQNQIRADVTSDGGASYGKDGLTTRDLVKLYQRSVSHVTVSKVLDPKFPALRAAWQRVRTLYPLPWDIASSILSNGFKDRAAVVYEEVVARNMTAGEQEIWSLLERRLYNPTQVETMRNEFENIRWKSDESVTEYADRLRELASCLPDVLSEQALCSRFIGGLPRTMKSQATVADSGNLDALVATTARLAAIQGHALPAGAAGNGFGRKERINEMFEEDQQGEGPPGCATNPVGPSQGRRVYAPHRDLRCYRCHRHGHVASGRFPCTWETTVTGEAVQPQGNVKPAQ